MNNIIKKQIEKYIPYNEQEENDKEMMLKYLQLEMIGKVFTPLVVQE